MLQSNAPSVEMLKALETVPNMYLVLSPDLYILTASNLYLAATETTREKIVGKHIFDAFPDNPDLPDADGVQNINASLQEVLRTKTAHYMPVQRYDVPHPTLQGKFIQRYWNPSHTPVLDEQGEIQYIIQLATNVTDQVLAEQALEQSATELDVLTDKLFNANHEIEQANQELITAVEALRVSNQNLEEQVKRRTAELAATIKELANSNNDLEAANYELNTINKELLRTQDNLLVLNDQLFESERRFRALIEYAPVALLIFRGDDMIFEMANEAMLQILGKGATIMGKPLLVGLPEIKGQPIVDALYKVYETGEPFNTAAVHVMLHRNGRNESCYFNLSYRPLYEGGRITGILETAVEVTEQMSAQQNVQALNDELSAINEELKISQQDLLNVNKELEVSKKMLDQILSQLPAPVVVLQGPDQIIETTNESLLYFWNKRKSEVLGKPMLEVFPELKTQPFPAQWKHVLETGETITNRERPVYFNRPEGKRLFYVDYHYQPLKDLDGKVTRVLATVIDNTDKVTARKLAEQAEAQLRLAIDSSRMGTWYINMETNEFIPSTRLKELFGYHANDTMTYEGAIAQISDEHKERVKQAIEVAIKTGERYEQEYTITGYCDNQLRWVKASGQLYIGDNGAPLHFSGTLLNITEQKQDEQRKNDFIGMASHELKTPLTSMKGYLQMLLAKAKQSEDTFTAGALEKANKQVNKMTTMINGFLNVSRLESGKIYIDKQRFDMADLVNDVEEETIATNTTHNFVFEPVESTLVDADKDKIGQVINNYISNAVKYSPAGSTIQVACVAKNHVTQVSVKDEGMGIEGQDINHLFDRYYRVEGSQMKSIAGFGIGLYLCAEIINRHEGKIWVESERGKGSTFYFNLPLAE